MDKVFRFSKWFILFCALLVAARLAQQYLADRVMEERASAIAERIYGWKWKNISGDLQFESQAKVIKAKVIKRGPNDGQISVEGNQIVMMPTIANTGDQKQGATGATKDGATGKPMETSFKAVLTLYKDKNNWILGKVEAK